MPSAYTIYDDISKIVHISTQTDYAMHILMTSSFLVESTPICEVFYTNINLHIP